MKEKELQSKIYNLLLTQDLSNIIDDIELYKNNDENNIHNLFSIKETLLNKYMKSVRYIYKKFESDEYNLIGNLNPQSISLTKNKRLFPDLLVHDEDRNFFIFELKIGTKTERETITEIFAYIFELRNHLPHINNKEISIIIISENFGTLLTNAVLQLIGFFDINIMCLKSNMSLEHLRLTIYNPIPSYTQNEKKLNKKSFSTMCISLYQTEDISKKANENIERIFKISQDILLENANRLNSNGFLTLYRNNNFDNEKGPIAKYYILIALINPFALMDYNDVHHRESKLLNVLYDMHNNSHYHLQNHFEELTLNCIEFLQKFYHVTLEGALTLEQFENSYNNDLSVDGIKCNVWGDFGNNLKKIIYSDYDGEYIFDGEVDHTNPFTMWEVLEEILDNN